MIILGDPQDAQGFPDARNLCITTNSELTQYLVQDFVSRFPSFRSQPALEAMTWLEAESHLSDGDMKTSWTETMTASGCEAKMHWAHLGEPFAVEVTPKDCATAIHDMYSVFLEARSASISLNGESLSGNVCERVFFGRERVPLFWQFPKHGFYPPQHRTEPLCLYPLRFTLARSSGLAKTRESC